MTWEHFAEHRDRICTEVGGWTLNGRATLHGYDIHNQLTPESAWMRTMILAVTGRLYPENATRLVEAMHVATGYPDPRIWCNRVVALAGTARCSGSASISAGIASADGKIYGGQSEYQAAKTIEKAHCVLKEEGDTSLRAYIEGLLKQHRLVHGFGRPLATVEERIAPVEAVAQRLGIEVGPHLATARRIGQILKKWRLIMNFGGYVSARLLDFCFSPIEVYRVLSIGFYIGLLPCYIEAFENEPGTFLPIACEDILYEGVPEREVPE